MVPRERGWVPPRGRLYSPQFPNRLDAAANVESRGGEDDVETGARQSRALDLTCGGAGWASEPEKKGGFSVMVRSGARRAR